MHKNQYSNSCPIEFVPADFYQLNTTGGTHDGGDKNGQSDDENFENDNHIGDLKSSGSQRRISYQRSYDPSTIEIGNIFAPNDAKSRLQQESLQLVVKNILHEVVLRPVQRFFKMFQTVEDIWVNNGNTTDTLLKNGELTKRKRGF